MVTNYQTRVAFLLTQFLYFAKRELSFPIYSTGLHPHHLPHPASFRTVLFENSHRGLLNQGYETFSSDRLTTMTFLSCLKTGICNCKYMHIIMYDHQSLEFKRPTHIKKVTCGCLFYSSLTLYPCLQLRSLKDDSNRISRTMFNIEIAGFSEFVYLVTTQILVRYVHITNTGLQKHKPVYPFKNIFVHV